MSKSFFPRETILNVAFPSNPKRNLPSSLLSKKCRLYSFGKGAQEIDTPSLCLLRALRDSCEVNQAFVESTALGESFIEGSKNDQ